MVEEELTPGFVIEQVKKSHKWLLANVANEEFNKDITNHSDELKHALFVQEMLERF